MKIAFDLDGTISKYPSQFLRLASKLKSSGCDVFVLTAAAGELPPKERPNEVKRRLERIGWGGFPILCCESSEKPSICEKTGVDFLIDDTGFNLNGTILLQVK